MPLTIVPLCLGWLEMTGAVLQRLRHLETDMFPCLGFLLLGGAKPILVDTGAPEPDCGVKTPRKLVRGQDEYLLPQLAKHGLRPEDIQIVVNTHLHWDHIYGNNKLPRAEILVQQAELDYYREPLPCDRNSYEKNSPEPFVETFLKRVRAVGDNEEIASGVRLLHTPGHTPGCQSVLVETGRGLYIIPGDNVSLADSLEFNPPWVPGITVDARAFYASMARLQALGGTLLPAHEKTLLGRTFPE